MLLKKHCFLRQPDQQYKVYMKNEFGPIVLDFTYGPVGFWNRIAWILAGIFKRELKFNFTNVYFSFDKKV